MAGWSECSERGSIETVQHRSWRSDESEEQCNVCIGASWVRVRMRAQKLGVVVNRLRRS